MVVDIEVFLLLISGCTMAGGEGGLNRTGKH